jgi:anaerobic selenocysteine-containing dehydrogenase
MLATVEDGRIVALRGDPAHPVTRGFLCYRTNHFLERQYSDERLTTPLVRKHGELVPTSWDEALDLVATRLREALRDHGPTSILHYQSGGSLGILKLLNRRFFERLGPVTHKRGDICSGAGDAAQLADMGAEDAHDLDDLANANAILLWGKNVAETGVHLVPHLVAARKRGVPIVYIDPVFRERTAALADRYVAVRPGGDAYLALALLRALFDQDLVHPEARATCDGFEVFEALVKRHDVATWAERAGVALDDVAYLVDVYGRRAPATLFVGWGLARRLHGAKTVRLLDALGAITGNLGVPGGGVSYYFQRRGGFDSAALREGASAEGRTLLEPLLGEELLRAEPKVRVAVIDNGNPVSQLPDSNTVVKGLRSVDFLVVLDPFLTDTAELAHVVLPTTTMLEEHDVLGAYGHAWVSLVQPVVPPPAEVRSDLAIYQALAERLGFGAEMAGEATAWIDKALAPMAAAGVTRAKLAEGGLRKPAAPRVLFEGRRFPTPTGRFQLIGDFPEEREPLDAGYPLELLSCSTYRTQSSQVSRASQQEPAVITVHPDAAPGFVEGELVRLVSPLAEAVVRLAFDASQRNDVVIYPKGRWAKYGGPNTLVRARATDHGEGAAYYDQGVRIEPLR